MSAVALRPIDLGAVRAVVFDLDGTLYDQRRLRLRMLAELALHCLAHPGDAGVMRRLQVFRRERERLAEEEAAGIGSAQYRRPAELLGVPPERIEADVRRWFEERPLRHLRGCRFPGVAELFARLRSAGRPIAVLSDYPAAQKLAALELEADLSVSAAEPAVDRLKPHPAGLLHILERLELEPSALLVIGDRDERDGECARRIGASYLLKTRRPTAAPHRFSDFREILPPA